MSRVLSLALFLCSAKLVNLAGYFWYTVAEKASILSFHQLCESKSYLSGEADSPLYLPPLQSPESSAYGRSRCMELCEKKQKL